MELNEIKAHIKRHKPSAAYLGRIEMEAMLEEARASGWLEPAMDRPYNTLPRLEYAGCPVFEVRVESHAWFAQERPSEAVETTTGYAVVGRNAALGYIPITNSQRCRGSLLEELWIFGKPSRHHEVALWRDIEPIVRYMRESMVHHIPATKQ